MLGQKKIIENLYVSHTMKYTSQGRILYFLQAEWHWHPFQAKKHWWSPWSLSVLLRYCINHICLQHTIHNPQWIWAISPKRNFEILFLFLEWFFYDKWWLYLCRIIYQYLLSRLTLVASMCILTSHPTNSISWSQAQLHDSLRCHQNANSITNLQVHGAPIDGYQVFQVISWAQTTWVFPRCCDLRTCWKSMRFQGCCHILLCKPDDLSHHFLTSCIDVLEKGSPPYKGMILHVHWPPSSQPLCQSKHRWAMPSKP